MTFVTTWIGETWSLTVEAAPSLIVGFLLAGIVYILMPTEKVVAHLGKPGFGSVIKAALIGVPLPLCSCSVIPLASSIRKRGASRGATASFLISTPESGVDSIAISFALLGPLLAVVRPIAAFASATVAGILISRQESDSGDDGEPNSSPQEDSCGSCHCHQDEVQRTSLLSKIAKALKYGLVEMFADLSHWLLIGFLLAGLLGAILPKGFLENSIGSGLLPMLAMLLAGIPLYVCATSATPIAAALLAKGLSPGAVLVFLLVGPATNMATIAVVARDLGRRSLVIYLLSIAVVAIGIGLGLDAIASWLPVGAVTAGTGHQHDESWIARLAAVLLILLMLNGLRLRAGMTLDGRRASAVRVADTG